MKDRMAAVKKQLTDKRKNGKKPKPQPCPTEQQALALGFAYERALGEYLRKPALRYFTRIGDRGIDPRTMTALRKALAISKEHDVDFETYVRAQFYWFHKWFRRAPKIFELCGANGRFSARKRLTEYLKLTGSPRVSSTELPPIETAPEVLDKINEKRVQQIQRIYGCSRQEILNVFGPEGVFDVGWLKRQS